MYEFGVEGSPVLSWCMCSVLHFFLDLKVGLWLHSLATGFMVLTKGIQCKQGVRATLKSGLIIPCLFN